MGTVWVYSIAMDAQFDKLADVQWIAQCAHRLRERWPHADLASLEEAACELCSSRRWRQAAPEAAAEQWLRLGVGAESSMELSPLVAQRRADVLGDRGATCLRKSAFP